VEEEEEALGVAVEAEGGWVAVVVAVRLSCVLPQELSRRRRRRWSNDSSPH